MFDYKVEGGEEILTKKLASKQIPHKEYSMIHESTVISCHDIFIQYEGGIILVTRDNLPAKGELWPIGGRIERGIATIDSLIKKAKSECNLELTQIKFLGVGRTQFLTDPFGHSKGTDTLNLVFFAKGRGNLKLDALHKNPKIIRLTDFNASLKKGLHPYVRDFLELALNETK